MGPGVATSRVAEGAFQSREIATPEYHRRLEPFFGQTKAPPWTSVGQSASQKLAPSGGDIPPEDVASWKNIQCRWIPTGPHSN